MLVSVHIPKTGGSSFKYILEQHFQNNLRVDYSDRVMKYSREENLKSALTFNAKGKFPAAPTACIHGHFLATKYKDIPEARFCTWLRDPVERIVSRYYHALKSRERLGVKNKDNEAFPTCLEEFIKVEQFQNIYARYLQNMSLTQFDFIGITENYDECLRLFSKIFEINHLKSL